MSLLRSFVLMECAVSIVDTSSDHSTSTVKWTPTPPILRWPATALTISSHPRIESTISGTVPNGFRPSAAMITRKNTSRLVLLLDGRGKKIHLRNGVVTLRNALGLHALPERCRAVGDNRVLTL